jgi:hypothetical protein
LDFYIHASRAESQFQFYTRFMRDEFTTGIERDGDWFVASFREIPGANGNVLSVAESDPLDRRYFELSEEDFRRFTAILDAPPESNPGLVRLLGRKAQWER